MTKAKAKTKTQAAAKKGGRASSSARSQGAAMPRSMQNRGSGDSRKAVQQPRSRGSITSKERTAEEARALWTEMIGRSRDLTDERLVDFERVNREFFEI